MNKDWKQLETFFKRTHHRDGSDKHILELLELSLKNNDFEFNNETLLQISGPAMGKKSHTVMQICSWHNGKI